MNPDDILTGSDKKSNQTSYDKTLKRFQFRRM